MRSRPFLQELRLLLVCLALALLFDASAGSLAEALPLRAVASQSMAAGSAVSLGRRVDAQRVGEQRVDGRQGAPASTTALSMAACGAPRLTGPRALASAASPKAAGRDRPFYVGHLYLDNCTLLC
jgi:hypothetical protein